MRQWLKDKRLDIGLTQVQIAKKLNIKQYDYSRIENGTRQKKISLDMASKLSELFSVPIEEILEYEKAG